jgi:hypothetical protein
MAVGSGCARLEADAWIREQTSSVDREGSLVFLVILQISERCNWGQTCAPRSNTLRGETKKGGYVKGYRKKAKRLKRLKKKGVIYA